MSGNHPHPTATTGQRTLRADCANCFGLCCTVPAFSASTDFAIDKPAGQPCPNLRPDHRCGIHSTLRQRGFPGCTVYDCFGAGQHVSQITFTGHDWRTSPETAKKMFAVFPIMRDLHELLWYLTEALTLPHTTPIRDALTQARDTIEALTNETPETIARTDVMTQRTNVNPLLQKASELARANTPGPRKDHRGADLIGAKLKGADLRGANLRGAYLIGTDLRGANLTMADLTGADTRGSDLRGADLSRSIFLTQAQLDAAKGDTTTKVPHTLTHPTHW
ncbi:pentapeptide repeat-containing protein [Streptosporangium saharense]|uniref:pentapeptide repeat-containing protein n=1 Tax=Streptosporangium saharense TaxID=1706840 RepID=UPI0036B23027